METTRQKKTKAQRAAMRKVAEAIKRGELPRLDGSIQCVDCGSPATCYDHRDYRRPVDVQPVCYKCNLHRGAAHPFRSSGDVGYEKREKVIKVRFNDEELALVRQAAALAGVSVATFARDVIDLCGQKLK